MEARLSKKCLELFGDKFFSLWYHAKDGEERINSQIKFKKNLKFTEDEHEVFDCMLSLADALAYHYWDRGYKAVTDRTRLSPYEFCSCTIEKVTFVSNLDFEEVSELLHAVMQENFRKLKLKEKVE